MSRRPHVATVLLLLALNGCATSTADTAPAADTTGSPAAEAAIPVPTGPVTAIAALRELPVKGRAPLTGYDRDRFGPAWADVDRNGCDTRNDILTRDLLDLRHRPGTRDCVVLAGTLHDPYTGDTIAFRRGPDTSRAVQIDHVVALANAWQTGAQQLDNTRRAAFANDPLNLLTTAGEINQAKGDGDAATWLPPRRGFRCTYAAQQIAVKTIHQLWVTPAEVDALTRVLARCPDQRLPAHTTRPDGSTARAVGRPGTP